MAMQLASPGGGDDRYGSTRSRASSRPGSRASAAKAWLTRPGNIHEMDDQFYIWVSYFSLSF
jgi:hypothetical protein